jgi:hypothetical protein
LDIPSPKGASDSARRNIFDPGTLASLLAQFNSRYPAINLEIQMGIGPDIAALSLTAKSVKRTARRATATVRAKTLPCCTGRAGPVRGRPDTQVGTFTQALYDEAKKNGWTLISMKDDWNRIFGLE